MKSKILNAFAIGIPLIFLLYEFTAFWLFPEINKFMFPAGLTALDFGFDKLPRIMSNLSIKGWLIYFIGCILSASKITDKWENCKGAFVLIPLLVIDIVVLTCLGFNGHLAWGETLSTILIEMLLLMSQIVRIAMVKKLRESTKSHKTD